MNRVLLRRSLKYYLFVTFLFTFSMGFLIYALGGLEKFPGIASLMMLIPAIVAIIVTKTAEKRKGILPVLRSLGFRLGNIKHIILYPMLMFTIIVLTYLVTYMIAPDVFLTRSQLPNSLSDFDIGFGSLSVYVQISIIFLLNSALGPVINIPLMLGEEVGWRGYLYPRLEERYGKNGMIIGGIIWGIWHAPMIFMGHNYPSTPFLGLLMMILFCVLMGIILYYIYIHSRSIITVALCHGVINQTASTIHMIFINEQVFQPTIHGTTGIIGMIVLMFVALLFHRKYHMKMNSKCETS